MFDFGMGELVVIFVVALIVVGPKKLPEVARAIGKGLGSLKKTLDEVKEGVQTEVNEIKDTSGIKEALNGGAELKKSLLDLTEQVKTDFKDAVDVSVKQPPLNTPTKNIADTAEKKITTVQVGLLSNFFLGTTFITPVSKLSFHKSLLIR
jgi:Tat protein translocase TatB subunit